MPKRTSTIKRRGSTAPAQKKRRGSKQNDKAGAIAKARRMRPRLRLLAQISIVSFILITAGTGWWFVSSGRYDAMCNAIWQRYLEHTVSLGLKIERIYIDGLNYVSKKEVIALIPTTDIDGEKILPTMGIDVYALREAIEQLPWVKTAEVERQIPNGLHIRITERQPVAIWQVDNELRVVDVEGQVLQEGSVARFNKLPVVVGDEANTQIGELFATLRSEPWLAARVASAVRVGNRRWDVYMKNNVVVKLPQDNMEKAWHHLAKLQREKRVLERAVKSVDLRLDDRITIQKDNNAPAAE